MIPLMSPIHRSTFRTIIVNSGASSTTCEGIRIRVLNEIHITTIILLFQMVEPFIVSKQVLLSSSSTQSLLIATSGILTEKAVHD